MAKTNYITYIATLQNYHPVRKRNVLLQHVEHHPFQNRRCHKPFKILLMYNLPCKYSNNIYCDFDLCHSSSYIAYFILTK